MNYFDNEKNVNDYISRTEGHDGKKLIEILLSGNNSLIA